jgi:predicted esterase
MWNAMLSIVLGIPVAVIPPDRGDLAAAYVRFERAVARAELEPDGRRRVNQSFDSLTGDFFAGRFGQALSRLASIEGDIAGEPLGHSARADRAFLAAHRVTVLPRLSCRVIDGDELQRFVVRADRLDGMEQGAAPTHVVLRQVGRDVVVDARALSTDGCVVECSPPFGVGRVEVYLRMPQLGDVEVGRAFILDKTPSDLHTTWTAAIDALAEKKLVDASTLLSLRARAELAVGTFERGKTAHFVADPCTLTTEVAREIAIAEAGGRPFATHGDRWRVIRVLGTEMPIRQYVPEGPGPFPLVLAFHGAGGDENLFFDGYGGGKLLEIARERRIAVVCPPTIPFGVSPNVLVKFLEELRSDINFDADRVGLLGHSLGAATASRLAVLRPELMTGVVCIAGFADLARSTESAARCVYLAEFDPLFPLKATRASIDQAVARGSDIEVVVVPQEGHTLVVGEVLDQAVEWLLARKPRKSASAPPTTSAPSTAPMNVPTNPSTNPPATPSTALPADAPDLDAAARDIKPIAGPMK